MTLTRSGSRWPRGTWADIRPTSNRERRALSSAFLYRYRNLGGCFFNRLRHVRAAATFYDKRDDNFLAAVPLAAIRIARKAKVSSHFGDGANREPAVHRLDAATLFVLALEIPDGSDRFRGVADTGLAFRDIVGVIGRRLGVPVASITPAQAGKRFGWLARSVATYNPTSSKMPRTSRVACIAAGADRGPRPAGLLHGAP